MKETLKYHSTTLKSVKLQGYQICPIRKHKALWGHFTGFSANEINSKCTRGASMKHDMSAPRNTARGWHNGFHVVICEFFWPVCQKHPSVAPVLTVQHHASWLAFARKRQKYFQASQIFFFYIWLNEAE